jgi:penicillin-binding protein 1A
MVVRTSFCALVLATAAGVCLWLLTPPVDDVAARLTRQLRSDHAISVASGAVPEQLSHALIATEDERFNQHHGIDAIGVARALLNDIQSRCLCQGGSTITQQVVKRLYLGGSDQGLNKIEGMVLALKLETVLNKQAIMAAYVSDAPMGPNIYGAARASCHYFGKRLDQLDLAQYALIAGLPQAPSADDPIDNPSGARTRRSSVLRLMVSNSYITAPQAAVADSAPLPTRAMDGASGCG